MSIEQAQAFIEKVKNDEDLAKRLNEAQDSESKLNIAKEMGYEFTPEEARQASEQLSPDELDQAAGGMVLCSVDIPICMGADFSIGGSRA